MVEEVRVGGLDKVPSLRKMKKVRVRYVEPGCKLCKISKNVFFIKVLDM